MSLNKFVNTSIKEWMNIGCDEISCNSLKIDGETIRPTPLVYSTLGNSTTGSIYPAITTIVYEATPAMGTLVSYGYKAGDQLQIVTRGIINSATSSNIVSVYLYGGTQLTEIQIPSSAWTTSTDIVVTSIYNFINSTQAYFYSTVSLPTDNQNVSYSTVNFPGLVPYNLTIALNAVATASFTHINTTITLI
jgi:hypothetical protein